MGKPLLLNSQMITMAVAYIMSADKPTVKGLCENIGILRRQYYRYMATGAAHVARRKRSLQRDFAENVNRAWKHRGERDLDRKSDATRRSESNVAKDRGISLPRKKPTWEGDVPLSELTPEHFDQAVWKQTEEERRIPKKYQVRTPTGIQDIRELTDHSKKKDEIDYSKFRGAMDDD